MDKDTWMVFTGVYVVCVPLLWVIWIIAWYPMAVLNLKFWVVVCIAWVQFVILYKPSIITMTDPGGVIVKEVRVGC